MTHLIFDYLAFSPREELNQATQRIDSEGFDDIYSLEGRCICIIKVFQHTAGIAFKPISYLGIYVLATSINKLIFLLLTNFPGIRNSFEHDREMTIDVVTYTNPDFIQRMQNLLNQFGLCSFAAPISQSMQTFKALLGIIHPGFYFKNSNLPAHMRELARAAREVGCTPALIEKLDQGMEVINSSLNDFPNREYFYAQYARDIAFICEKFRDPEFPAQRKHFLLSMLNPDPSGSGIEACPAGLGRTLQQMRANIQAPEDQMQVLPWLASEFKEEIMNRMVIQVEARQPNSPAWHLTIRRMAHDQAHRGNCLIAAIGRQVGLSQEVLERVHMDPLTITVAPLPQEEINGLLQAFNAICTQEGLMHYLIEQVNSKPDGSPGLKTFRDYATRILSERVTEREMQGTGFDDPSLYVVNRYYINQGQGSPSDPNFNDLNEQGIRAFAALLGWS